MPDLSDLSREVHLWSLPTEEFDDTEWASRAAVVLSSDEQKRADRFAFAKDRRSYIAAHWLLRSALSHYVPIPPGAWAFGSASRGKPVLSDPKAGEGIQFNLSHTSGMVACAVTCIGEVGVDVETVRPRDHINLARRYFAPNEVLQLELLSAEDQSGAFFRFWTLKEAFIKAKGLGLAMDLASFAFPQIQADAISIEFAEGLHDLPGDWSFFRHEPDPRHKIAVAVSHASKSSPRFKIIQDVPPGESLGQSLQ